MLGRWRLNVAAEATSSTNAATGLLGILLPSHEPDLCEEATCQRQQSSKAGREDAPSAPGNATFPVCKTSNATMREAAANMFALPPPAKPSN
jgi:hypothetical protein